MSEIKIERHCRAMMESDHARGRLRSLWAYKRRFAGFEEVVERVYESFDGSTGPEVAPAPIARQETVVDPVSQPVERDSRAEELLEHVQFYARERYRYAGEIGAGAMGRVVEVVDRGLERQIAMKLLREPEGAAATTVVDRSTTVDPAVHRFVREARIMARLDHPGIVPVYDFGVNPEKRIFFTMKRVEGRGLDEIYEAHHSGDSEWPLARVVQLLVRAADAVGFAHSRAIVHRDLKPPNVMVGSFGEVYVMDWGLAKCLDGALERRYGPAEPELRDTEPAPDDLLGTRMGAAIGSPTYMPPEQAVGDLASIGPASDVYGLGACLYHLLAGDPPYVAGQGAVSALQIILAARKEPPPALAEVAPDAPAELVAIAEKAMQRAPEDRYANATAFGADLQAYLEGRVVSAHRSGTLVALTKWIARNRALASSLAAMLLLVVCGSIIVAIQQYRAKARVEQERGRALVAAENEREARREAEAAHGRETAARTAAELAHEQEQEARAAAEAAHELAVEARTEAEQSAEAESAARREADGERLAAQASHLAATDPGLALLIGLRAAENTDGPLVRDALATAITDHREVHALEDCHEAYLSTAVYSPDGKTVLSGGHDRIVVAWDAETGAVLREYPTEDAWTWRIRFAPDGKSFATFATDTNVLRFRDLATGDEIASARVAPDVGVRAALNEHRRGGSRADFEYTPDGRSVFLYGIGGAYQHIDAATGELIARSAATDPIECAKLSEDGSRLAVLHRSGALSTVLVAGCEIESSWPAPEGLSIGLRGWCRFREQGTQIAVGYGRSVRGRAAGAYVRGVRDGALVDLRSDIGPCILGDGGTAWVTATRVPSRATPATELRAIDVEGGAVRHRLELQGTHTGLVPTPKGARIAVLGGTKRREGRIWNLRTGAIDAKLIGHGRTIESLAWRSDGRRAVTASQDLTARIWDMADPRDVTGTWTTPPRPHQRVVAFSVRGNRAVIRWSETGGERMALVALDAGTEVKRLDENGVVPARVTMAAFGERVAMALPDGDGSVWTILRTRDGHAIKTLRTPGTNGVLSPDGSRFAAYGGKTIVHTFDVTSGEPIVGVPVTGASNVRFAPGNRRLVTCDGGNLSDTLWDLEEKRAAFHFRDRGGFSMGAAWSHDGRYYASTAADRAVFFRDTKTGTDSRRITSIADGRLRPGWSPDGRWLSVHWSTEGRIYSVEALRSYRTFTPDGARWESAEFHPTLPELWVSDTRGRILRIAIDVVAAANSRRHRQLTLGELKRYRAADAEEYRRLCDERGRTFRSFLKLHAIAGGAALSGRYDGALAMYDRLLPRRPYLAILHLARARVLAQRSTSHGADAETLRGTDQDAAVAALREAWKRAPAGVRHPLETGEAGASALEIDAALQSLRDHAGFKALVEEVRATPSSYLR